MSEVAAIDVSGVSKVFETDAGQVVALEGVDLRLGAGEFVAVIGPSGCGKTSLLRIVGDLESETEGEVLVQGVPAAEARKARKMGVVFQTIIFDKFPGLDICLFDAFFKTDRYSDNPTFSWMLTLFHTNSSNVYGPLPKEQFGYTHSGQSRHSPPCPRKASSFLPIFSPAIIRGRTRSSTVVR